MVVPWPIQKKDAGVHEAYKSDLSQMLKPKMGLQIIPRLYILIRVTLCGPAAWPLEALMRDLRRTDLAPNEVGDTLHLKRMLSLARRSCDLSM